MLEYSLLRGLIMKRKRKFIGNIILSILIIASIILFFLAIKLYLASIDEEARKISNLADTTIVSKDNKEGSNGLYLANVKEEVFNFIGDNEVKSIKYEVENENFYLIFSIAKDKDGNRSLNIDKIVDANLGINARTNKTGVETIEYRTGNANNSTLLKINEKDYSSYFAMTEGTYYFLGSDIESVSFMNGQFYYMSYNPDYTLIEEYGNCGKEVKSQIDGFSTKAYYYRYGKINFLTDYYQKLASKTYTVGDKCKEYESDDKQK